MFPNPQDALPLPPRPYLENSVVEFLLTKGVNLAAQILSPASMHTQKAGAWHGIPAQSPNASGAEVL